MSPVASTQAKYPPHKEWTPALQGANNHQQLTGVASVRWGIGLGGR